MVIKIKKISILPSTKLFTGIMAIVGLIAGILYSFGGLIIDALVSIGWINSTETPGLSFGTILAFGALIGMPLIFAVFGFISASTGIILYNLLASKIGGIEIEFDQ